MKANTTTVLTLLEVACWIIFIGLCIEAGAVLYNYAMSMVNPEWAKNLYRGLDSSHLYQHNRWYYTAVASFMIVLSGQKAYVFYLVILMFRKLNMTKPFSEEIAALIAQISYYTFSVGLIGIIADQFTKGLLKKGLNLDGVGNYWNDSGAFLLMAGVLFVIAQIFRKGIELQAESELTV